MVCYCHLLTVHIVDVNCVMNFSTADVVLQAFEPVQAFANRPGMLALRVL